MLPRHSLRYAYALRSKNCGYVEWCRLSTEYRRVTDGQTATDMYEVHMNVTDTKLN